MKISANAWQELKNILSQEQIKTDSDSLKFYGKDWTTYFDISPSAIAFPQSASEVQELVHWARKHAIGLVPSGGRTGLSGAAVATNGEIVVSFEKMNRILSFNEINGTVLCEAGVITENLQKFASEKGLSYPVDFAARGSSQLGGNIATNAGGIKVVRYGLTRDWITGLKVVTGAGEILDLNKSLVKNATGLDLRHLFIGSEGILGFVIEATVKLAPQPPPLQVMVLGVSGLSDLMQIFAEFRRKTTLVAFEMFSEKALQKVMEKTGLSRPFSSICPFYVLLEIEVRSPQDHELALEIFETCVEKNLVTDGAISQSNSQAKAFWRLREDISESLAAFSPYKNDVSVSISKVPALCKILTGFSVRLTRTGKLSGLAMSATATCISIFFDQQE